MPQQVRTTARARAHARVVAVNDDETLERCVTRRLLCGVRITPLRNIDGRPLSPGVIVGSVAAAATTGALVAMGHRVGHAGIPFAAIGAVPFRRASNGGVVGLVFVGLVFHVVAIYVWSVIAVWLARHSGRPVAAAILVAIANFFASWLIAWSSGSGLASVLQLGDRIVLAVVLAAALMVGMRYAFSGRELHDEMSESNAPLAHGRATSGVSERRDPPM